MLTWTSGPEQPLCRVTGTVHPGNARLSESGTSESSISDLSSSWLCQCLPVHCSFWATASAAYQWPTWLAAHSDSFVGVICRPLTSVWPCQPRHARAAGSPGSERREASGPAPCCSTGSDQLSIAQPRRFKFSSLIISVSSRGILSRPPGPALGGSPPAAAGPAVTAADSERNANGPSYFFRVVFQLRQCKGQTELSQSLRFRIFELVFVRI